MYEAAFHRLAEEIRADIEHARALLRRHVAFVREIRSARRFLLAWRYNPDQPRVPAGNPDGGQWTSGDGSGEDGQPREMMRRPASPRPPMPHATLAQRTRFDLAKARADEASARVLERDPTWKPPTSVTRTTEGMILHQQAVEAAANAHHAFLVRWGIGGPGAFAAESFPAPIGRPLNRAERDLNDVFGFRNGCSTCGTFDPGSPSGRFHGDHQPNTGWNFSGSAQRIHPQCAHCSATQGGYIRMMRRRLD